MIIHDGRVRLIGDPHFGKPFNGTPLTRRGEREAMQLAQFKEELNGGEEMVVMVGDLFDRPFVPLPLIHDVAQAVRDAAHANYDTTFIMMAGNHDKSRQLGTRAAWELFCMAVGAWENVVCLDEPWEHKGYLFFPWQWDVAAEPQVALLSFEDSDCHTAIGHWDLMDFGGDTSHMVPVKALQTIRADIKIYSGHYHLPGTYEIDGVEVICTGSMQPYTHAEDPDGDMYVTLTTAEALARDDLHDMCVRLILEPGESAPDLDCLQLTLTRADTEAIEVEVSLGGFNMKQALADEFVAKDVPEDVQHYIMERVGAVD